MRRGERKKEHLSMGDSSDAVLISLEFGFAR